MNMSFQDVINEMKNNPEKLSAYKDGLLGIVQIIDGKIIFRDMFYQERPLDCGVSQKDMESNEWQLAVKVD
jgi:hypothetical protein